MAVVEDAAADDAAADDAATETKAETMTPEKTTLHSKKKKKKKKFRKVRKQLARATGQRHVVSRTKRFFRDFFSFDEKDEDEEKPSAAEKTDEVKEEDEVPGIRSDEDECLLESRRYRQALCGAIPKRLWSRELVRQYAASTNGYSLETMNLQLRHLENKPCLLIVRTTDDKLLGSYLESAPFGNLVRVTSESKASSLEAAVFRLSRRLEKNHRVFRSKSDVLFDEPGTFVLAARTKVFFAVAANAKTGGAALRLSATLDAGTSEASALFGSQPLHSFDDDDDGGEDDSSPTSSYLDDDDDDDDDEEDEDDEEDDDEEEEQDLEEVRSRTFSEDEDDDEESAPPSKNLQRKLSTRKSSKKLKRSASSQPKLKRTSDAFSIADVEVYSFEMKARH